MNIMPNSYHRFVTTAEQINTSVRTAPQDFVRYIEDAYNNAVQHIAQQILSPACGCRIVMLTGPSGSGKTTTAKKLSDALAKQGFGAVTISLDDFFLGEARTAPGKNGKPDYESVYALDIPQVHSCMFDLLHYGYCKMPKFNFRMKKPYNEKKIITLPEGHIAIIEGLHALNPVFTDEFHCHGLLKLYVSVKQGIPAGGQELLSAQDIRFLRRMVRDYQFRKALPAFTFDIWPSVCEGEKRNIAPYKKHSDFTLNTIHLYEPCAVGGLAVPLLKTIERDSPHHRKAQELLEKICFFAKLDLQLIPQDSLLREFIGGGSYSY